MKKDKLFQMLRFTAFLAIAPLTYLFWEGGAADYLVKQVKAPVVAPPLKLGTPAPSLEVPQNQVWSRTTFSLAELKGYPIILHFWATWCGPCLIELPELIALAKKKKLEGFVFITVAVDEDWNKVESFFQTNPTLRELVDHSVLLLDSKSEISLSFASSRFPETFLINQQLVVDNKFVGAQNWLSPMMAPYLDALKK